MNKYFLLTGVLLVLLLSGCEKKQPEVLQQKCNASDYPQVTIGTQVWMAENYRCSKYDTESEAYKEGRKSVSISTDFKYTPYYSDGAKISKPEYMSDEQRVKLGFLYNWAAAVGVADGLKQTEQFGVQRQGICPNGWHIPSKAEWDMLVEFIEVAQSKGVNTAGKHLKSASGWNNGGNGVDTYGFTMLATGYSYGANVLNVGSRTGFWLPELDGIEPKKAYNRFANYEIDDLDFDLNEKSVGQPVRCVKNN